MTRRAEQIPLEDDWVLTKVWSKRQSAPAILAAVQAVPRDEAFIPTPFGAKGEPFDPPEVVPLAGDSVGNGPPNCDGFTHAGEALAHAQHEAATDGDDCTSGACLITRGSD